MQCTCVRGPTLLEIQMPYAVKPEIKPVKSVFACKLKKFSYKLKVTWAEINL